MNLAKGVVIQHGCPRIRPINSKFNSGGSYVARFAVNCGTTAKCMVAVADSSGKIRLTDNYNNILKKFTINGSLLQTIGTARSCISASVANDQFCNPSMIIIDFNDNIWAHEERNNRIQEFNPS
jgi:hypothetical protein